MSLDRPSRQRGPPTLPGLRPFSRRHFKNGHAKPGIVPIDNLKAVLVAWVIAGHAFLGYAAMGGWPYDEVAETTLPRQVELGLEIIIRPTALFVIGAFFFLSGLLAPDSIARQGSAGFIRQRLLRLGLP